MTLPAKKSLGQHFLHHPATLEKIVSLAKITSQDQVLEIGPGPGGLTRVLARKAKKLVAIEKDKRFAQELQEKFRDQDHVTILEGDILEINLSEIWQVWVARGKVLNPPSPPFDKGGIGGFSEVTGPELVKWKVIANLPYNIATEIIFRLLEHRTHICEMYLMVQKEVADRLVAQPGSKDYGVLSIMSQLYSQNKIVMKLAPGFFFPPPKVHSAVVSFLISETCRYEIQNHDLFSKIVRTCFSQRRKMILNPLRTLFSSLTPQQLEERLKKAEIQPFARPEMVAIEKFARVSNLLVLQR